MRAHQVFAISVLSIGCVGCSSTVTQYRLDSQGNVMSVQKLTPDESWKRTEDDRIAAEVAGREPEAGIKTWREYWKWSYKNIRRDPGPPPWKPTQFKNAEEMVAYIEEHRKARGLPAYD
jgi:hypothetical protein